MCAFLLFKFIPSSFKRLVNSKRLKILFSFSSSNPLNFISSILKSIGASSISVHNSFPLISRSLYSSIRSPFLISPVCNNNSSTLPYSDRSFAAVFGPIPGKPGILSEGSPVKALKSGICSG